MDRGSIFRGAINDGRPWIYGRVRNDEITRAFVEDMAKIHLPQTYALLEKICERQGIETPKRPQINWVDLQNPRH